MLEQLKQTLCELHRELPRNNLVTWTSGNVSLLDRETGFVVIKPSGVRYEALRPEDMVVVDGDGRIVEGKLSPSSDTASHLYIYRHRADVGGIVHSHSPYATAFAAVNRPIPVYLTAQADEFGGAIPCGRFALIGGEEIGKVVVESIGPSPAVLLRKSWGFHHRPNGRSGRQSGGDG
jgi:L-ribulose-5-phosphate 4-epimerase